MKKSRSRFKPTIITLIFTFILTITLPYNRIVRAEEDPNAAIIKATTNVDGDGHVKAGSDIEITVNLDNLTNFYAGSVEYTYDNTLLQVSSIEVSPKIKEHNPFEAYNDVARQGNKARYGFTFMSADEQGISGQSNFVTIKAKALKDGQLTVGKQDFQYQLVSKVDGNVKEMSSTYFKNKENTWSVTKKTSSDGKKTEEKVELVASNQSNNNNSETNKDGQTANNNASENKDGQNQENGALEQPSDQASEASDSESNDDKGGNTLAYVGLALGCMVVAAGVSFVVYKKRKK
ncbi:cohesin domain-containing protein [Clostridium sp. HBUAS56017]|uniref:cohesin domain-containing protein n=1 Tax=Clostridium sp. HBUAS56017 TaxID=2571128 RepID=UPI0011782758|nr:cohesin domain-containing protein [Clostridium sp. HBUAS56017]